MLNTFCEFYRFKVNLNFFLFIRYSYILGVRGRFLVIYKLGPPYKYDNLIDGHRLFDRCNLLSFESIDQTKVPNDM